MWSEVLNSRKLLTLFYLFLLYVRRETSKEVQRMDTEGSAVEYEIHERAERNLLQSTAKNLSRKLAMIQRRAKVSNNETYEIRSKLARTNSTRYTDIPGKRKVTTYTVLSDETENPDIHGNIHDSGK